MCIITYEDVSELPEFKDKTIVAYKIMTIDLKFNGEPRIETPYSYFPIKTNKWEKAYQVELRVRDFTLDDAPLLFIYHSGFHVYMTFEDAVKGLKSTDGHIVEVKVRGVYARGLDGTGIEVKNLGLKNLVAKEMYLDESEVKRVLDIIEAS